MAAAFRSVGTTTYASRTNTTIPAPSGIVDGDVLVLGFAVGAATPPATVTLPTGFTQIGSTTRVTTGGQSVDLRIALKTASSESGSYTVTHDVASSVGFVEAISGGTVTGAQATFNSGDSTASSVGGITDSFTAANGTALGGRTTDTGSAVWFAGFDQNVVTAGSAQIQSNRAVCAESFKQTQQYLTSKSANAVVSADCYGSEIHHGSLDSSSTTSNRTYAWMAVTTAGSVTAGIKYRGSSYTLLTQSFSAGMHRLSITVTGANTSSSSYDFKVDGVSMTGSPMAGSAVWSGHGGTTGGGDGQTAVHGYKVYNTGNYVDNFSVATAACTATGLTPTGAGSLLCFIGQNWEMYGGATTLPTAPTQPTFTAQWNSTTSLLYLATGVTTNRSATGTVTQSSNNNVAGSSDQWQAVLLEVPSATFVGSVYSVTMPEALTGSDSAAGVTSLLATMAELRTATDTSSSSMAASAAMTDSVAGVDASAASIATADAVADTASAADTLSSASGFGVAANESVAAADAQATNAAFVSDLVESGAAIDSGAAIGAFLGASVEAATATESVLTSIALNADAVDAATVSDASGSASSSSSAALEPLSAFDLSTTLAAFVSSISETGSTSESAAAVGAFVGSSSEAINAVATPSFTSASSASLGEAAGLIDSGASSFTTQAGAADGLAALDAPSASTSYQVSVAESGSITNRVLGVLMPLVRAVAPRFLSLKVAERLRRRLF